MTTKIVITPRTNPTNILKRNDIQPKDSTIWCKYGTWWVIIPPATKDDTTTIPETTTPSETIKIIKEPTIDQGENPIPYTEEKLS